MPNDTHENREQAQCSNPHHAHKPPRTPFLTAAALPSHPQDPKASPPHPSRYPSESS
ncbi:hypothetical protein AAT19DRAFT_16733 [Rhodotorula toruloides]|uniref:Uncharacterized protein n=1 Tax=Rhodotorula toruloides TaxID=5286 RepID=A0A2T0A470_RHOTO|nr:hypothetical protein AAT19DRAFT_16733 [Rhodotorula toruloides]